MADADTGTLRGDLTELAVQMLDLYAGRASRAALRLSLEAELIPGVAEHYAGMRRSQVLAARAIVRRGIERGELAPDAPDTLLLDTLTGGAMMHALTTPPDRRPASPATAGRTRSGWSASCCARSPARPPPTVAGRDHHERVRGSALPPRPCSPDWHAPGRPGPGRCRDRRPGCRPARLPHNRN